MANYTVPLLINGKDVYTSARFDVVSPATGKVVHKSASSGTTEALEATAAAAEAFKSWRNSSPIKRRDILLKAAEILERRKDELKGYIVDETGCAPEWGDFNLGVCKDGIVDTAGRIASLEGSIPTPQDGNVGALVLKEPFGAILSIAPWNAPYILGVRAVVSPIAAGNTVVLKGSEMCPRVMWAICSVFQEAGLPAGVLNLIVHEPANAASVTQTLIAHPAIRKINFTGSTAVGRIIGKLAGENLKPILLELGGKAPAIVWEDADLDNAAVHCALGAFLNSGQVCMATERILVHKNVRTEFERKLKGAIDQTFNSASAAPVLINASSVEKNKALLRDAVTKGASLLYGDLEAEEASKTRMRPIVVSGVREDMDIYSKESFGPSVSLFEIETEEEALRIANDTEYGLSAAVFTEDLRRGLRFAKNIDSGAVHINKMTVHDESALPHGGAKASGFGRFNAVGINEWVKTKTVTFMT